MSVHGRLRKIDVDEILIIYLYFINKKLTPTVKSLNPPPGGIRTTP